MKSLNQSFSVQFRHQVHFTTGLFQPDNPLLASVLLDSDGLCPHKIGVVLDEGVAQCHSHLLEQVKAYAKQHQEVLTLCGEIRIIPGGESVKNHPSYVEQMHRLIHEKGLCRHSYLLVIGGGAVLDMAGYAAATAHRGVRLIRVPTTVLAQHDSGVGVKNGINYFGKKNFVGTFAPPFAVLNDFAFLSTLENRDWCSGIAEAVKVALLKDPGFFQFIRDHRDALYQRDLTAMKQVIHRCTELHLDHICQGGDPFELGSSRPLDFGHWAAHKLEQLTEYALRHGEAVAIGIALDTTYAHLTGMLSRKEWEQVLETLQGLGLTLSVPELSLWAHVPHHPQSVFRGLEEFREHLGGQLTLTMLEGIGKGVEVHEVETTQYQQAISILKELGGKKLSA